MVIVSLQPVTGRLGWAVGAGGSLSLHRQSWSQPACEPCKAVVVGEALLLHLRSQIGSKPCPQGLWMPLAELEPTQCILGKRRTPLAALRSYGALEILLLTIAP